MKSLLITALTLAMLSCGQNTDKKELLTALTWTIEKGSIDGEMPKATETYRFLPDGTYALESENITVHGKWRWTKDDEIYLQTEGLILNRQVTNFDQSSNSYIRVVELTDRTLRTLERSEGDSWDSGFAKTKTYRTQEL
jgi:hypothetical protein